MNKVLLNKVALKAKDKITFKRVLAVETSCDDTSVAIVHNDGFVEMLCSATKDLDHAPYGGIVPEIASRNHTFYLLPLIEQTLQKSALEWKDIDGLVVTNRPGLIGALIVGITTIKSISQVKQIPFVGVNHLEGHLVAPFLKDEKNNPPADFDYPYLALAISGGHTTLYDVKNFGEYKVLGTTRDDAAGEVFDKFAKILGLGFPGGIRVDQESKKGDPQSFAFPRILLEDGSLEMSFSGLKSSAQRLVSALSPDEVTARTADLCASFQEAIVDTLMTKLQWAQKATGHRRVILTGGVSANSRLRTRAMEWAEKNQLQLVLTPLKYCTDNAAMIGFAGIQRLNLGQTSSLSLGPKPHSEESDFQ